MPETFRPVSLFASPDPISEQTVAQRPLDRVQRRIFEFLPERPMYSLSRQISNRFISRVNERPTLRVVSPALVRDAGPRFPEARRLFGDLPTRLAPAGDAFMSTH